MKNKLYAAYGSNLNLRQMSVRCPDAIPVGQAVLNGWQLAFRGVATLEPVPNAETPIGIWEITPKDEMALDRYEGYPRLYRKECTEIMLNGEKKEIMLYLMNDGLPSMPTKWYLDAIAQGYEDIGLDTVHLTKALEYTKEQMEKTKVHREDRKDDE